MPGFRPGAGERNRTPDLLITNQLLYLLSYTSMMLRNENPYRGAVRLSGLSNRGDHTTDEEKPSAPESGAYPNSNM